ncbi:MAG: hypothetical protein WAO61_04905 [Solirubrobacterales bacterium]
MQEPPPRDRTPPAADGSAAWLIKEARRRAIVSQVELARRLGTSQ